MKVKKVHFVKSQMNIHVVFFVPKDDSFERESERWRPSFTTSFDSLVYLMNGIIFLFNCNEDTK